MANYATPGVYIEEKSVLPLSVAGVSTAIPAFIGYTEKSGDNSYNKPVKITTLKEYEELFGRAPDTAITVTVDGQENLSVAITEPESIMYYAIQMFFDNGGDSCYIVPVAPATQAEPDNFGNAINALRLEDEPTIVVLVDGVPRSLATALSGTTNKTTAAEANTYYTLCGKVLQLCADMKDRFGIFDVIQTSDKTEDDIKAFRDSAIGGNNLKYGAAYYPYVQTTIPYQYSNTSVAVSGVAGVTKLDDLKTGNTALYNKITKALSGYWIILPPSSALAGVYARTDRDRGVWKSPANVSLASVTGPARKITEGENDIMNIDPVSGKSVNAVRFFTGKGTLSWGGRTLAGNDNEWRYISVRRLFNYIEESIQKATAFAVFEPNNAMTWLKLRSMVESFLDTLWRQGALAGGKAEDAYFVQVGLGTTMTSNDILEGRLIIKVGLAAVRPAEFIILEFTHKLQVS